MRVVMRSSETHHGRTFRLYYKKLNNPLRAELFVCCDVVSDGLKPLLIRLSRNTWFFLQR